MEPLTDDAEWITIKHYNTSDSETWDQRGEFATGRKWGNMDLSLKLRGPKAGSLEGTVSEVGNPHAKSSQVEKRISM